MSLIIASFLIQSVREPVPSPREDKVLWIRYGLHDMRYVYFLIQTVFPIKKEGNLIRNQFEISCCERTHAG